MHDTGWGADVDNRGTRGGRERDVTNLQTRKLTLSESTYSLLTMVRRAPRPAAMWWRGKITAGASEVVAGGYGARRGRPRS